ncbi:MAG: motility protein A [Planctomycetaceae bacterium]|jgi:chemotaxis protein MotA|nr:motility protein A [Planctomycetaceae bacterium]
MDIGTIIGVVMGSVLVVGSVIIGGGDITKFIDYSSVAIVVGGSVSALLICYPLNELMNFIAVVKKVILNEQRNTGEIIERIVSLSESARRDGILALEERLEEIKDPFLVLGIRMAVDGMSPEVVEAVLRTEMDAVETRHDMGKSVMGALGTYAPAFGMIGTLIGLVLMLANMDPEKIGSGMAVALLTTLYGAVISNLFCLPFVNKLGYYSEKELLAMEITVRGVIAIQAGENPRVIKQKLSTFIPPRFRKTEEEL